MAIIPGSVTIQKVIKITPTRGKNTYCNNTKKLDGSQSRQITFDKSWPLVRPEPLEKSIKRLVPLNFRPYWHPRRITLRRPVIQRGRSVKPSTNILCCSYMARKPYSVIQSCLTFSKIGGTFCHDRNLWTVSTPVIHCTLFFRHTEATFTDNGLQLICNDSYWPV